MSAFFIREVSSFKWSVSREEEFTATSFAEATEGQEGAKVAEGRGGRVRGYLL
jgi:hypothetical protein